MERHEPELAGMRRRAGHHDPTRLEQRTEGVIRRAWPRAERACGDRGTQLDQRVDRDRHARCVDDQRVDVDADDVGPLGGEPPESDEQIDQAIASDRRFAAQLPEQRRRRQRIDHLIGCHSVERRRSEDDVADRLGEHASDAEHHRRPELRVAHHPGDQLPVAAHHRRNEQRDVAVGGGCRGEQFGCSGCHRSSIGQAQADQPALGLVGDSLTRKLDHDREAELGRRARPPPEPSHEPLGRRHQAVGAQQLLGRVFREGAGVPGHVRQTVPTNHPMRWSIPVGVSTSAQSGRTARCAPRGRRARRRTAARCRADPRGTARRRSSSAARRSR